MKGMISYCGFFRARDVLSSPRALGMTASIPTTSDLVFSGYNTPAKQCEASLGFSRFLIFHIISIVERVVSW